MRARWHWGLLETPSSQTYQMPDELGQKEGTTECWQAKDVDQ